MSRLMKKLLLRMIRDRLYNYDLKKLMIGYAYKLNAYLNDMISNE